MKGIICCDVDPVLSPILDRVPGHDIWSPLQLVRNLVSGTTFLPPITWLIRSDESVRYSTGDFASGYLSQRALWTSLQDHGHEIGWHMHPMSYDNRKRAFGFDPDPTWLGTAHEELAKYTPISTTRIGWDFGSETLFRRLDELQVRIDLSALPGNLVWCAAGHDSLVVDWVRCPQMPYHPCTTDYQSDRSPSFRLLEVPITQFSNPLRGRAKRMLWRARHGSMSVRGLSKKTRLITEQWPRLPEPDATVWAFFFHPEELTCAGINNLLRNVELLAMKRDVEFVTACAYLKSFSKENEILHKRRNLDVPI
jgi:hypothetical protein